MDVELEAKELEFDPPTTPSVPSVDEMLGRAEPLKAEDWLQKVGWSGLSAAVAMGAIILLIIVLAIRRAATVLRQRRN
jgi:hypothetical protein